MKNTIRIEPMLITAAMQKELKLYNEVLNFETYHADDMYAVLKRKDCFIHLQ